MSNPLALLRVALHTAMLHNTPLTLDQVAVADLYAAMNERKSQCCFESTEYWVPEGWFCDGCHTIADMIEE